jgi:hypothetical protein
MSLRIVVAAVLGSLAGGVVTYVLIRPRAEPPAPAGRPRGPVEVLNDTALPPVVTKRESIDPNDHGLKYPPISVRRDPTLDVTNEHYDCLNWPEGLKADARVVLAQLSSDGHELEVRVGSVLGTIHDATILTLRDDQTGHVAIKMMSDFGSLDEDSDQGMTGEVVLNSLDWPDPHICGTFDLNWTKDGRGNCCHGSFSIQQADIRR